MTYPIPDVPISTPYGARGTYWSCNEDSSGKGVHTGVDFACPSGTNIYAPIPGQIRHRNYGSAFGNHQFAISPDPGQAFEDGEVFFAHTTNRPADGVYVDIGDYLADVGAEGNVSGPHLHMELHADSKGTWSCSVHDNPQPVLDYAETPPAPTNPGNPNNVAVGQTVVVTAEGALNGRAAPDGEAAVVKTLPKGSTFVVKALVNGWAGDTEQPSSDDEVGQKATGTWATGDDVPPSAYLNGWDISSHQGPDWQPASNETFGWVKCTEGKTYLNPSYDEQIVMARSHNQVVGHYHWLNDGDVQAQVDWFVANADVRAGEMIACDWEDSSNPTTAQKDQFIEALQEHYPHNRVGLYCNRDWWLNHDTSSFAGDYLWIANYGPSKDDGPGIQFEWLFWQHTSSPYDKNYGRFDSVQTLRAWAYKDAPPDPPDPPDPEYVGVWYSTDYLDQYEKPPEPVKPSWGSAPYVILDDSTPDPDRNVSYAQDFARVGPVDTDDGEHYDPCYIVAQDYNNAGDLRFYLAYSNGEYANQWMQVNDGGHGQTFHAYRSAAGNLYVWCGEDPAYRYRWQNGAKVAKTSGDKMDYKGARPVGSYEPWVGFRNATDTTETFYLFDRTDFTDGSNRTNPAKTSPAIAKRTNYTQQSWAVSETRIYRLMGATNDDPPHGSRLHILDVFDWSGRLLLDRFDVTAMAIESTSDEPEGLSFSGTPGDLLAGKREGSTDPKKRSYPIWKLTGLP